jgi:hypothetical protein
MVRPLVTLSFLHDVDDPLENPHGPRKLARADADRAHEVLRVPLSREHNGGDQMISIFALDWRVGRNAGWTSTGGVLGFAG